MNEEVVEDSQSRFGSLIEKIDIPSIPVSEEIIPRDIHDMILNPFDRIVHKVDGKECVCKGEDCPKEKYECLEWEKEYYEGKLKSFTVYELFPIPQSKYYQQKTRYHIVFLENGKISEIQHPNGYQYFDKNENIYKVCELYSIHPRKGCHFRKCWEKDTNGKWIYREECWID